MYATICISTALRPVPLRNHSGFPFLKNIRLFILAHQIEKSYVLPHVRNSYPTLVISPRSHYALKCSFLTLVV